MKFKLLIVAFVLTAFQINAQKITKESLKEYDLLNYKKTVKQALKYNDVQTAISSVHQIIALEGVNSSYKDSLAIIYFQSGHYVSSHLLSKELLAKKPNNIELLTMNAVSLQKLNVVKEAIDAYEKLFLQSNDMTHGYQLANLQYSIKRLAEAKATIAKTLLCKENEQAFVQFPVDKNNNQNVSLKAAAYNLQGLVSFELKDYKIADSSFKEALKIMPKFAVATQNANALLVTLQNSKKEQKVK